MKQPILIVDDDSDALEILSEFVQEAGAYEIITATSGPEARKIIKSHESLFGFGKNKISAIILDHYLPGEDSTQFIKNLAKETRQGVKIPVIICSAMVITPLKNCNYIGFCEKTDKKTLLGLLSQLNGK